MFTIFVNPQILSPIIYMYSLSYKRQAKCVCMHREAERPKQIKNNKNRRPMNLRWRVSSICKGMREEDEGQTKIPKEEYMQKNLKNETKMLADVR